MTREPTHSASGSPVSGSTTSASRELTALEADRSVLLLIDQQSRLMPAIDGGEAVVANALRLAQLARALGMPVLGTEQSPAKLGPLVPALREACDEVISKTRFDACPDGLYSATRRTVDAGRWQLVLTGCEAHVCLMQTALGLLRHGHGVWVVRDACGSRSAHNRDAAMDRLQRAGAVLVTTEMVGFEWVRHADHPQFRTLQNLVR